MHGHVVRKLNKEFSNIYHYHLSSISQMVVRRIEGKGTGSFLEGIAPIPPPTPAPTSTPRVSPLQLLPLLYRGSKPLFSPLTRPHISLTRKDTIVIVVIIV